MDYRKCSSKIVWNKEQKKFIYINNGGFHGLIAAKKKNIEKSQNIFIGEILESNNVYARGVLVLLSNQ